MIKRVILLMLLITQPVYAGTTFSDVSKTTTFIDVDKQRHFMHYVQGIVVDKVIKDEDITQLRNAAKFGNKIYAKDLARQLHEKLVTETSKASSSVDIYNIHVALMNLIGKIQYYPSFSREVELLQEEIQKIREAKEASQKSLSKEEIADMAKQAEEVLGAMVFTQSEVLCTLP